MNFEDYFSHLASTYSKYRPGYPPELFKYLAGCCKQHELAWDCGTGNGQAAAELIKYFAHVHATDASKEQIEQAQKHHQITFSVEPAEKVSLPDSGTDLITVAVAVHWFDFEKFYTEVKRVLKPGGVIAVWTYHLPEFTTEVNAVMHTYYYKVLKGYWSERIQYLDERYSTIPFPFNELKPPEFKMETVWDFDQLIGFLHSWSATKKFQQDKGKHPLEEIREELTTAWGDIKTRHSVNWPLHLRVGRVG